MDIPAGGHENKYCSVEKMTFPLKPGRGVGDLRFGDSRTTAKQLFGPGIEKEHSSDQVPMTSLTLPDHGSILYFDELDRMTSVIVDADSGSFTLLGKPIQEVFGNPPTTDSVKKWVEDHGFTIRTEMDFMGCFHYDVGDDGLIFAFPDEGMPAVHLRSGTEHDVRLKGLRP